jgi:predicted PurR-regulated permease PerM
VARIALVLGLLLLSLWIAREFLTALSWAVVIALASWPTYRHFAERVSKSSKVLVPLAFTGLVSLVLFLPVALAMHQAALESQALAQSLAHIRLNGLPVPAWLSQVPLGDHGARWWSANLSDPTNISEWLGPDDKRTEATWTRALGGELLHRLFLFFMVLIALFVLLRDGAWIGNRVLETADRLLGDPGERLASKMVDTVRGTVTGTVVVAVAEGILIGAAYVFAGVPNPLLFALLTMAFAMVPFGAWVVFTAAALLLAFQGGSVLAAASVFGVGAVVMLIGDTFIWPALVGNQARMPFLVALIGIFGGLQTFGLIGLFLGPMVLATLWIVWRDWLMPTAHSHAS